jgi:CheY-like chemotaxis protein
MPYTIFILDDNQEILELTKCSLEHLPDVTLHTFSNPHLALKNIETSGIPDLIITDLKMAHMNGIEFLTRLSQQGKPLNAIIFTGNPATLPPACNYHIIFKDFHGFDKLVLEVESMLHLEHTVE